MIKQIFFKEISYYPIVINYGSNGLLIFDYDRRGSGMMCLFKWTGVEDDDGVDRQINIEGHMACIIMGVDEI